MPQSIPLQGLYLHLVRSGFPLSVRDYQDAVVALRRGYGSPRREDLHWLCQTLWARTDHEVSRVDRLFREFPWPSDDDVRELSDHSRARAARSRQRATKKSTTGDAAMHTASRQTPAVEFATPSESGVGLPSAATPKRAGEVFIFSPRPLLNLRSLILAWRRFRVAQRFGPPVELDIDATIDDQSRRGFLLGPVLLPARRNLARLVVLVDASESMTTWHHMNRLITESLAKSQLGHAALYYFDNVPDELYEQPTLSRPVNLRRALQNHPDCRLVVMGDAGAARGRLDRERVRQVRGFVNTVRPAWSPIAWLNPMPTPRWLGTTAESIARLAGISMFQFADDGVIQAVDYLRGK